MVRGVGKGKREKQDETGLRERAKINTVFFLLCLLISRGNVYRRQEGGSLFQNFLNSHLQLHFFFMETLIHLEIVG